MLQKISHRIERLLAMTLTLSEKYIGSFVSEHEYDHIQPLVSEAHRQLCNKTGAGAEMLGWKNLP